jgi:putative lumazine-binding protein
MISRSQLLKLTRCPRSLAPTLVALHSMSLIPFAPFSISAFGVLILHGFAIAQDKPPDDNAAITKTALDYIEGWYTGDAARMEHALHPELAKRMISTDPRTGRSQFNHMGAMALVQRTRDGGGKKTPPDRQLKEITILDRYNNGAVVKIVASDWIDYLEVARFNGDWKIINVLWELKPK